MSCDETNDGGGPSVGAVSVSGPSPLFEPESLAVVAASHDGFYSGNLVENLLGYGFDWTLYPVKLSRDEVRTRQCHDDTETVDAPVRSGE